MLWYMVIVSQLQGLNDFMLFNVLSVDIFEVPLPVGVIFISF